MSGPPNTTRPPRPGTPLAGSEQGSSGQPFSAQDNKGLSDNKKQNIQTFGQITIDGNSLCYGKSVLQISNITHSWIGVLGRPQFPSFAIVLIAFGALVIMGGMSLLRVEVEAFLIIAALGAVLIIPGIVTLVNYDKKKHNVRYGLHLEMSSGYVATFSSYDLDFLDLLLAAVTGVIKHGSAGEPLVVNLDQRTINSGIINQGPVGGGSFHVGSNRNNWPGGY